MTTEVIVPGLVIVGLLVVLGPALVGRGVLLDVNLLSARLPFRTVAGLVNADAITCRQDTIDYFPAIAQIKQSLLAGVFPTWTPYEVGGAPLASQPSSGVFTPLALPYFVLPLWLAPAFVKLAEVVVGIAGTIAFLRRRGVSRSGAWLAGFVFVTSGFMVAWSNWPQTRVAALIPLLLWATDRVIDRHRARDAVVLAVVFAAMLLGGFPAVTLYALTAAGVYALVRVWTQYRGRLLAGLGTLVTAVAGLVLGFGLAAFQLLPFLQNLSAAFSERDKGGRHLPFGAAATLLDPGARGTCRGGVWFGDTIPIEVIGYVGSAAVVLAVFALGSRRRDGEEPGIRAWLLVTVLVAGSLIWVGGPLLSLWAQVPVVGNNAVSRAQSVVGFLTACLVALGYDRLPGRDPLDADAPQGRLAQDKVRSARPAIALIGGGLLLLAILVAAVVDAIADGYLGHLAVSLVAPLVLLTSALAVLRFLFVGPPRFRTWGPTVLVLLVVAQGAAFAHTMLPLSQRELLYPVTPTHRYLQDNIGHDRYGAGDLTMGPSVSDWYRLRTPTGHDFTDPRWKDLLAAVDPDVQRTVTYAEFSPMLPFARVADSAILDRLAVRYWTANPRRQVGGTVEPVSDQGRVTLSAVDPVTCRVGGGPLRAVNLRLVEPVAPAAPGMVRTLRVQVTSGGETRIGEALLDGRTLGPGRITVAVAGEDLPEAERAEVQLSISGTEEPIQLAGEDDEPSCSRVTPAENDRVRLVHSDAGGAIYERLDALPRIRWAAESRVVRPDQQVAALADGLPDDTVLLGDTAAPTAQGGDGSVEIADDDGGRIVVDTTSTELGYLVVADSIDRPGWSATVDGVPTPIVAADHAFAAVAVPAGEHRVELAYTAPGLRAGVIVSAVSGLTATVLLVAPVIARRRGPGEHGAADTAHPDLDEPSRPRPV